MTVAIQVSLFDSGCLPSLLDREIANTERLLRSDLPDDSREQIEIYKTQLANCRDAVARAREHR